MRPENDRKVALALQYHQSTRMGGNNRVCLKAEAGEVFGCFRMALHQVQPIWKPDSRSRGPRHPPWPILHLLFIARHYSVSYYLVGSNIGLVLSQKI